MQFIGYWQLRLDKSHQELLKAAGEQGLMDAFPPDGVEILRWDVTPSDWGIVVMEAEDAEAIDKAIKMWQANQSWFEEIKVEPARPVEDRVDTLNELFEELS